jgi:hypothetical protein
VPWHDGISRPKGREIAVVGPGIASAGGPLVGGFFEKVKSYLRFAADADGLRETQRAFPIVNPAPLKVGPCHNYDRLWSHP